MGWKEILKSEHRNMKESIVKCINHNYTQDPDRARKILKDQFEEQEVVTPTVRFKNQRDNWKPIGTKGLIELHKQINTKPEVTMGDIVIGKQNVKELPMWVLQRDRGKMIERFKRVQAKQSKINLKFTDDLNDMTRDMTYFRPRVRNIDVHPDVIHRFNKEFKYRSDNKAMRAYHTSVKEESPFNKRNAPPVEYLMDTGKVGKVT